MSGEGHRGVRELDRPSRGPSGREDSLWWFILRRLFAGVVILFIVSFVVFMATQALPGDVAHIILGQEATPDQLRLLRQQLHLEDPVLSQYWRWLSGLLTGGPGNSLFNDVPVTELLGNRVANSAILGGFAMVIIIPVSVLVGVIAALRRDRLTDKAYLGVALLVTALPEFVIGSLLIVLVFVTKFYRTIPPVSIIPPGELAWSYPKLLVLPVSVLVLVGVTYLSRLVRASFIDVMNSEYAQLATLKGLSRRRIVFRHILPNALAPSIPAASILAAYTLAGLVVVEYLFGYPGLGTALVSAVTNHDIPVIQAIVMLMAAAFYFFNFLADVLAKIDKRQ